MRRLGFYIISLIFLASCGPARKVKSSCKADRWKRDAVVESSMKDIEVYVMRTIEGSEILKNEDIEYRSYKSADPFNTPDFGRLVLSEHYLFFFTNAEGENMFLFCTPVLYPLINSMNRNFRHNKNRAMQNIDNIYLGKVSANDSQDSSIRHLNFADARRQNDFDIEIKLEDDGLTMTRLITNKFLSTSITSHAMKTYELNGDIFDFEFQFCKANEEQKNWYINKCRKDIYYEYQYYILHLSDTLEDQISTNTVTKDIVEDIEEEKALEKKEKEKIKDKEVVKEEDLSQRKTAKKAKEAQDTDLLGKGRLKYRTMKKRRKEDLKYFKKQTGYEYKVKKMYLAWKNQRQRRLIVLVEADVNAKRNVVEVKGYDNEKYEVSLPEKLVLFKVRNARQRFNKFKYFEK